MRISWTEKKSNGEVRKWSVTNDPYSKLSEKATTISGAYTQS